MRCKHICCRLLARDQVDVCVLKVQNWIYTKPTCTMPLLMSQGNDRTVHSELSNPSQCSKVCHGHCTKASAHHHEHTLLQMQKQSCCKTSTTKQLPNKLAPQLAPSYPFRGETPCIADQ